jgi:hypothetical protein
VVTVISTVPAAPAGEVALIDVALVTVKLAALVAPKLTDVAPLKFVPVIVTLVAPVVGPDVGLMLVTAGAGVGVGVAVGVAVGVGVGVPDEQGVAVDAEFLGTGPTTTSKSLLLLSVS